jgi:ribosome-binding factor A
MKSQRQLQIGENIKRIISEIFFREDIATIPGCLITILEADVSPDAKNVKIFVDIFGNESQQPEIIEKLNKMAPHFRYQLAQKITLRVAPEISFVLDNTGSRVQKIESLIELENKKLAPKKRKK